MLIWADKAMCAWHNGGGRKEWIISREMRVEWRSRRTWVVRDCKDEWNQRCIVNSTWNDLIARDGQQERDGRKERWKKKLAREKQGKGCTDQGSDCPASPCLLQLIHIPYPITHLSHLAPFKFFPPPISAVSKLPSAYSRLSRHRRNQSAYYVFMYIWMKSFLASTLDVCIQWDEDPCMDSLISYILSDFFGLLFISQHSGTPHILLHAVDFRASWVCTQFVD